MNATKTTFQWMDSNWQEWNSFGSAPGLKWTDAQGNDWRAIANYQFDSKNEQYMIIVNKFIKPEGLTDWIFFAQYAIVADYSKYRKLSTGEILESIDGVPAALDNLGNIVDPEGWVYNSKYFTISLGYNLSGAPVSVNHWAYLEIADKEGLII